MTDPTPSNGGGAAGRIIAKLMMGAAIFGIGWSVWLDADDRLILGQQQVGLNRYAQFVDPPLEKIAGGGGLYLHFVGFERFGDYATNFYFRANYVLFPQRVLAGDPSVPINTPTQILEANFLPDDAWLKEHQVPTILTIICTPNPEIRQLEFFYQPGRPAAATTR
jgi:hypothetical protein